MATLSRCKWTFWLSTFVLVLMDRSLSAQQLNVDETQSSRPLNGPKLNRPQAKRYFKDKDGKIIIVDADDPRLDPKGRKRWINIPQTLVRTEDPSGKVTFRRVSGVEAFLADASNFVEEQRKFIVAHDPQSVLDPEMQEQCVNRNVIFWWMPKETHINVAQVNFVVSKGDYEKRKPFWDKVCEGSRRSVKELPNVSPESLFKETLRLIELIKGNSPKESGYWGVFCKVELVYSYSKKETRKTITFEIRNDQEERGFFLKQIACWLEYNVVSPEFPGPLSIVGRDNDYEIDPNEEQKAARKAIVATATPQPLPPDDGLSIAERKAFIGHEIDFDQKRQTYHFDGSVRSSIGAPDLRVNFSEQCGQLANAKLTESQVYLLACDVVRKTKAKLEMDGKVLDFRFKVITEDDLSTFWVEIKYQ